MIQETYGKLLAEMREQSRISPIHILLTLQHPKEEETAVFVQDLRRVLCVFANPMRMVLILDASTGCNS